METNINVSKVNDKSANLMFLNTRLTWVWLSKPQEDLTPGKYSYKITGLIPVSEYKKTIRPAMEKAAQKLLSMSTVITDPKKRKAAYEQAFKDGEKKSLFKFGDKQVDKEGKVYAGCQGMMLFTAHTSAEEISKDIFKPKNAITLLDRKKQPIAEHAIAGELYSGVFANVAVSMLAYTFGGEGLTLYLNGVMKVKDGEKLGGSDPFASMAAMDDDDEPTTASPDFGEESETPKKGKKGK